MSKIVLMFWEKQLSVTKYLVCAIFCRIFFCLHNWVVTVVLYVLTNEDLLSIIQKIVAQIQFITTSHWHVKRKRNLRINFNINHSVVYTIMAIEHHNHSYRGFSNSFLYNLNVLHRMKYWTDVVNDILSHLL